MPRRILFTGFGLLGLVLVGVYLLLFPPLPLPPDIGQGLPRTFSEADEVFKQRVLAEFPLPISEEELSSRLDEQGFSVDAENSYAFFEKSGLPCKLIWRVHWEADQGVVTNLNAVYGGICL